MSLFNNPGSSSGGRPASTPAAVLDELRQQAERKAAYKMFYSAADVFRDYKGPYASETAAERAQLTAEYDQRGRDAEKQRLEGGPLPASTTPKPAYRPPTPTVRPAPKPAQPGSSPKPAVTSRQPAAPLAQVKDGQIIFACRWCKESLSLDVAKMGQILPCPKCDSLISVPKV